MLRPLATVLIVFTALTALAQRTASERTAVYTDAQAKAGKLAVQNNKFGVCSDCHGAGLKGRTGKANERPALSTLPEDRQVMIRKIGRAHV